MRRKFIFLLAFAYIHSLFPFVAFAADLANGYDQSAIEEAQLVAQHTAIVNGYKDYLAKVAVRDCKDVLSQHKSGILVSFVDKKTHQESQVMIECKANGTADAFSAEEVALRIESAKRNPNPSSCALLPDRNLQNLYIHADRMADIIGAHAGKCENNVAPADSPAKAAKHTSSCVASLEESFFSSWKGSGSSGAPNCVQTLLSVFFDNIVSTGKFMVDMAAGAANWTGEKLSSLWNSMMNSDNRNSNSVLAASALSLRDTKALSKNDKESLWSVFQRFSSNVLLGINHLMSDYVGCQHWSGQPFHSQCVAPLNFACITCGQGLNLACGVIGIIGSEAVMFLAGGFASGGIASVVGSLAKTPQILGALNSLSSMRAVVAAAEVSSSIAARARALNVAARAMPGVGKTMLHAGALGRLPRSLMNNLVSRVPLNTEMRALYASSVRLGAKSGDKLMEAVGVGKISSSVIQKVELLNRMEKTRDKFLKDSVLIFRAGGEDNAAKIGKIRAAYRAYMKEAKKSFEAMGYSVDVGSRGSLLVSDPKNSHYFTYEIKSVSSRLSTMRKSDSLAQVIEYLKKEDTLFASPAALADHVSTNLMPAELAEAITYRRSIEPRVGFEAQLAGHELGRYENALNTDAKYNVNPHSKYIPTSASIY